MIKVTRTSDKRPLIVNEHLILVLEDRLDLKRDHKTLITLSNGSELFVDETVQEILDLINSST